MKDEKSITPVIQFNPAKDTQRAKKAADLLVDIVRKNGWAKNLGGQSEHLQYEAWQTLGKFYDLSVKTYDAQFVEYGGIGGFEAKAEVINNQTGMVVGGAEAICMKDEYNWKAKPLFQLKSMAQTRAGSKALRQILGFVVALAGYNPTPSEEMDNLHNAPLQAETPVVAPVKSPEVLPDQLITNDQKIQLMMLIPKKGKTPDGLRDFLKKTYKVDSYQKLTTMQADYVIKRLEKEEDKKVVVEDPIDNDQVDEGIKKMAKPPVKV